MQIIEQTQFNDAKVSQIPAFLKIKLDEAQARKFKLTLISPEEKLKKAEQLRQEKLSLRLAKQLQFQDRIEAAKIRKAIQK